MDLEHMLSAVDQARLTTEAIYFDSVEGQAWMKVSSKSDLTCLRWSYSTLKYCELRKRQTSQLSSLLFHLIWKHAWDQSQSSRKWRRARVNKTEIERNGLTGRDTSEEDYISPMKIGTKETDRNCLGNI